jgi:uncharacterized protein HemX
MYGASPDWIRAELERQVDSAKRRLASLTEIHFPAAIELLRLVEWSITFYTLADFRGWRSGTPAITT